MEINGSHKKESMNEIKKRGGYKKERKKGRREEIKIKEIISVFIDEAVTQKFEDFVGGVIQRLYKVKFSKREGKRETRGENGRNRENKEKINK